MKRHARPLQRSLVLAALLAFAAGCAGVPPVPIALKPEAPAAQERAQSLRETVERLSGAYWNPGRLSAVEERAQALGLAPYARTEWIDWWTFQKNLVIELPGTSPEIIYLVAHYDKTDINPLKLGSMLLNGLPDELFGWSYLSRGAYDNATGVAVMLEVAAQLAKREHGPTYRILITGGEESGLRGSRTHVARLTAEEWGRLRFAVNVDSVAKDDRENCVMDNASDPALLRRVLVLAEELSIPLESGEIPLGGDGDQTPFAYTDFWHDFGRGLLFNLAGGLLPQRSWFTGRAGTAVLTFASCDVLDFYDYLSGNIFLPLGRLHGPRDNGGQVEPEKLYQMYTLLNAFLEGIEKDS